MTGPRLRPTGVVTTLMEKEYAPGISVSFLCDVSALHEDQPLPFVVEAKAPLTSAAVPTTSSTERCTTCKGEGRCVVAGAAVTCRGCHGTGIRRATKGRVVKPTEPVEEHRRRGGRADD